LRVRYRDTKAPLLFSLPKISGAHSGEDVTDISTRKNDEKLRTNIH
jgi:hypothetical protein